MSDYFDNKINDKLVEIASRGEPGYSDVSLNKLLREIGDGYTIEPKHTSYYVDSASSEILRGMVSGQGYISYAVRPRIGIAYIFPYYARMTKRLEKGYYNIKIKTDIFRSALNSDLSSSDVIQFVNSSGLMTDAYDPQYVRQHQVFVKGGISGDGFCSAVGLARTEYGTIENPIYPLIEDAKQTDYVYFDGESYLTVLVALAQVSGYNSDQAKTLAIHMLSNRGINDFIEVEKIEVSEIDTMRFSASDVSQWPDVTYRELQSASFELNGQFGQLDRETDLFSGVSLGRERLLPNENVLPSETLYPNGTAERANKAMYSQLWADKGNVRTFRNIEIHYKTLDQAHKEVEAVYIFPVNTSGTDDYIVNDNWLLNNLIWTEEEIIVLGWDMVDAIRNISWFPFELWCSALPYLEVGDEIEINLDNEVYTSYILQRTMKGMQRLEDTYINGRLDIF